MNIICELANEYPRIVTVRRDSWRLIRRACILHQRNDQQQFGLPDNRFDHAQSEMQHEFERCSLLRVKCRMTLTLLIAITTKQQMAGGTGRHQCMERRGTPRVR
jgi:hypothetical protein